MSSVAVSFQGVRKSYRVTRQKPNLSRQLLRWLIQQPSDIHRHEVLRGLDFTIHKGESVGIIGRNGAGKSTLLSLIARTAQPNVGTVDVKGRVGPLLELGAGFHPELTGAENVYLNGMLLGMTRQEIRKRFDDIADFAGIGDFLYSPINTYSTGMRARLGFAVVAHIDPDILLLDEVLGVGDIDFRNKCSQVLHGFRARERTIILVSHSAASVRQLCERAIWIEHGLVKMDGTSKEVLDAYTASGSSKTSTN